MRVSAVQSNAAASTAHALWAGTRKGEDNQGWKMKSAADLMV